MSEKIISFNFDKKQAIILCKQAISSKMAIIRDGGDALQCGAPPDITFNVLIKDHEIRVSGGGPGAYLAETAAKEIEKAFPAEYDDLYNIDNFMKASVYVANNCKMCKLEEIANEYDTIIYEGGQGLMLDQANKDGFPHLTPSSTGCRNIADEAHILNLDNIELYYVSRSYLTRHGAGPMIGECEKNEINPGIVDKTNEENEWQGSLRFGKLDLDKMANKILKDTRLLRNRFLTINMVYTQLNYTGGKLETTNGRDDVRTAFHADHIYVSDQRDRMEKLL